MWVYMYINKHIENHDNLFFAKTEPEKQKIENIQISPSPESYKIKRNVWIPRGTTPGPKEGSSTTPSLF